MRMEKVLPESPGVLFSFPQIFLLFSLPHAKIIKEKFLTPLKDHTFFVCSLNGMAVNVPENDELVPAGVNVHIGGAVQLDGQNLVATGSCT